MEIRESMSIKEKTERWKLMAEIFLKNDTKVFVKDVGGDIYFADIILVGDDTLTIKCFGPEQRKGEKFILYWALILEFEDFKGEAKK